jgi:hypothetical protein
MVVQLSQLDGRRVLGGGSGVYSKHQVFAMDGKAQIGEEQPVFGPYFSTRFSTQWEASLEG